MTSPIGPVVVDTNVAVYLLTGHPRVVPFRGILATSLVLISFQTAAELGLIARRRAWGADRLAHLDGFLGGVTTIPSTDDIIEAWVDVMYRQIRKGSRLEVGDAWVAATALVHDCPVVTNDRKDFGRVEGLKLLPG